MSMPISPNFARGSRTMQSPQRMGAQQQQPGGGPVEGALAYGRRKMGLPGDFERGNVAAFEDGGVVPDPSAAPPPQPEATDPEAVLKYLSGDGALSPDVIMAMEAMADPDNTMDATDRLDAVLGRAPSPDVAFGVLQHHRTKFNGYTAAAKVASQKGDYAKAAAYANKAHASVPGSRRRFAPGRGGLQMIDAQPSQPETPAFGQGGSVDSSNPNDEPEEDASYADGGEVDTRYDNMPDSENITDRRGEHGEGWVGKGDGPIPEDIGAGTISRYYQGVDERKREASDREFERNSGVVRKQQAFEDGGVVDDEDVTAAVTPDDGMGGGAEDDALTTGATMPAPSSPSTGALDPMSLSPEDFDRMMAVPYDTAVNSARKNIVSPRDITDAIGWAGGKVMEGASALGRAAVDPRNWPTAPLGDGWSSPMPGASRNTTAPTDWSDPDFTGIGQGDPSQPPAPAGGKTPDQMAPDESSHAEKMKDPYREGRQHANERRDEMMQWYEAQSRKLFPWASQEGQRQQFIMNGMERFFNHDVVRENELTRDRAGTADRAQRDKMLIHQDTEAGKNTRAAASQHTKQVLGAAHESGLAARMAQGEFGKYIRTAQQTNPDALSDPAVLKQVQAMLKAQNIQLQAGQERAAVDLILGNKPIQAPRGDMGGGNPTGEAPGSNHVAYLRAHPKDPATRAAFARRYGEAALKQYAGE